MPALHALARTQRCKRLRVALAVVAASGAVAACSDHAPTETSQEQQQTQSQQQTQPQPPLATTFNTVPLQSASSPNTSLQTPQSTPAQSQATMPGSGAASATDSVVLAPPVIHTVD